MKISAILSDYDGTLCPTSSLNNSLPEDIHNILIAISKFIPVCIVSSKDFQFLGSCVDFARIISSIMGIETFILPKAQKENNYNSKFQELSSSRELNSDITNNNLLTYWVKQKSKLIENSSLLENLSLVISKNFQDIRILRKYTYNEKILAAVSFDYRHLLKWENYKSNIEPR